MKKPVAILILCALLFQCLAHYTVLGLYALRRDYIASHLCVNRDKPELKCCGKCYLRKQLKKVDGDNDPGSAGAKTEREAIVYILPDRPVLVTVFTPIIHKPFNPGRQHMMNRLLVPAIFHPPPAFV